MRYHIDTIPVWDAMKLDGECFLCALERKTEIGEAERYLGASVMEPAIRIQVNEKGFCRHHHAMLYGMSNRLGHALMLESHTAVTRERLAKLSGPLQKAASAYSSAPLAKVSRAGTGAKKELDRLAEELRQLGSGCVMCGTIRENMDRYCHTFFHLYQNDADFRAAFAACKGVCLPHMSDLVRMAADELPAKEVAPFVELLLRLEKENADRIQEDVSWFIRKFDYRFEKEPWKNSRDAVPRTVNKLRGWCVGDEPNPKR